jgi:prevent-host-death family protein
MVILWTMIVVNVHQAKAKLSEYLEAAANGERVVICKRNQPIAELSAIEAKRAGGHPIGGGPYEFNVPDAFFEPMPGEFLDAFGSALPHPASPAAESKAAEPSATGSTRIARRKRR